MFFMLEYYTSFKERCSKKFVGTSKAGENFTNIRSPSFPLPFQLYLSIVLLFLAIFFILRFQALFFKASQTD